MTCDDALRKKCEHTDLVGLDAREAMFQWQFCFCCVTLRCLIHSLPGYWAAATYLTEIVPKLEDYEEYGTMHTTLGEIYMPINPCFFKHPLTVQWPHEEGKLCTHWPYLLFLLLLYSLEITCRIKALFMRKDVFAICKTMGEILRLSFLSIKEKKMAIMKTRVDLLPVVRSNCWGW